MMNIHQKVFYSAVQLKLKELVRRLQIVYRLTKNEKFKDEECFKICREYIVALQMSMVEKILVKNDEQRSYELVTYLTDLQLEPIHKMMTLKSELNQTVK
ncbi:unnamed protein product [Rotaria sp. Silwood1]